MLGCSSKNKMPEMIGANLSVKGVRVIRARPLDFVHILCDGVMK